MSIESRGYRKESDPESIRLQEVEAIRRRISHLELQLGELRPEDENSEIAQSLERELLEKEARLRQILG